MSLKNKLRKREKQTKKVRRQSPPGSDIPILLPTNFENPLKGKDFFKFVNGKWLDTVHVPSHISSYGVSEELEQSIKKKIQEILNTCIGKSKSIEFSTDSIESIQIAIGRVARSALNAKVQQKSVDTLKKLLSNLGCMRDQYDVARTMGEFIQFKIPGVFWLFGQYENQNHTEYTFTIGIGKVGLPDLSYYKKTAPGKSKTLLKYANLLHSVGKKFQIENLSHILPLEELLSAAIQKSLTEKSYLMKGSAIAKDFPDLPLEVIFKTLGLENWETETFFVDSRNWLETLQKLFQFLPIEWWRLLFTVEAILHFLPYLPPPFDDEYFAFFHRYLRGQTEKVPQKHLTVSLLEQWMTPFLSRLYVNSYGDPILKRETKKLVDDLMETAKERLETVNWLQPVTRKKAVEKVSKMTVSLGYPDSFNTLTVPTVNSENLVENLLELGRWQTAYEISRLGEKRIKQKDWDEPVFAVNAYYYSQSNEMVIPLGSLYWPFYSPTSSLGWNYGGLGCILGHELTHAFDKDGKEYDPDGFPKKWWTTADNRAFNKKSKTIIQLFSSQKILNHRVSGALTLSENIADLGGLAISLDSLTRELKNKNVSEEEKKKAYQNFFLSYALSWRVKEKPEKTLQSLFLDYHAPASLRVNMIVNQFDEWYSAFGITEKDPMYIPPEKRIRIF